MRLPRHFLSGWGEKPPRTKYRTRIQGRRRMTFTYPIINRARRILWLVTGADKSVMLDRLLTADPSIPAGRVSQERAIVFADRAAAGGLQKAAQPQLKELKIFPERRKQKMRVGIITDHGGFSLKEEMVRRLVAVAKAVLGGNR